MQVPAALLARETAGEASSASAEVGMPGRSRVDDGDCPAANVGLDAGVVAQVGGHAAVAELADAGYAEVGNRGIPPR